MSRARSSRAQQKKQQQHQHQHQPQENTISFQKGRTLNSRQIELVPKSLGQERLVLALDDHTHDVVIAVGPAGTGKSYLGMLAAIRALRRRDCERIVLTRPAVGVDDERHGFLPGDLNSKMEPWTRPLLDILREFYHPRDIANMIEDQTIEIAPLCFMRGRTFKDCWIVADEMQNATPAQMKMLLTRIGSNSRILITGDVEQTDRSHRDNGLWDLAERLKSQSVPGIEICTLGNRDVQRHAMITRVLDLYRD